MISADSWDFLPFSLIFPELTLKEVDTVMWLYMHFNTENIATLTNVHVDVLRKRLRKIMKKLNVYSKVELEAVVGRRVLIFTFCPETKDETFSSVATVVELTPEMNRLLSQAAARSRRSKTQEATIRLFDHLKNFPDIATEGRRFRENN